MRWAMVNEMNAMDCRLKEIKIKHDQWSENWRKWDEIWTVKCGLKEMRWNMNHDVDNVMTRNLYVTNSILRVLVLRFWISGSWVSSPRVPVPGSQVPGSRVTGLRVPGSWIPGRPWLQGRRYQAPESQVLILDYLVYIEHLSRW